MMIASFAKAQTINTGHLEFSVSDLWEFQLYNDDIHFSGPMKEELYIYEEDFSQFPKMSLVKIEGMYDLFSDQEAYKKVYLDNGDLISLFRDNDSEVCIYYKDKYVIQMYYRTQNDDEDARNTLLTIANTVKRSDEPKSNYDFRVEATENFLYGVPRRWFHIQEENKHYYYGGVERTSEKGMMFTTEYHEEELVDQSYSSIEELYEMMAYGFQQAFEVTGEIEGEFIEVDGIKAYTFKFFLNIHDGYLHMTICKNNDRVLVIGYADGRGAAISDYSDSIVEAINNTISVW